MAVDVAANSNVIQETAQIVSVKRDDFDFDFDIFLQGTTGYLHISTFHITFIKVINVPKILYCTQFL